eukprot:1860855-Rhodomonas_salina.2
MGVWVQRNFGPERRTGHRQPPSFSRCGTRRERVLACVGDVGGHLDGVCNVLDGLGRVEHHTQPLPPATAPRASRANSALQSAGLDAAV